MTVEALLRRAPRVAVFGPRDAPASRTALAAELRSLGLATYELAIGPTVRDALQAWRATPPGALPTSLGGTIRRRRPLRSGERAPRRSLSILVDGTLRR